MNKEHKEVPIDSIIPYWRNPRDNTRAIEQVKKSIEAYGYIAPIVVDKGMTIIAGHTRYKALKELGYKTVDVIIVEMEERKAKEYRIIDNKSSEFAIWTDDLIPELKEFTNPTILADFFPNMKLDLDASFQKLEVGDNDLSEAKSDLDNHFQEMQEKKVNALLNLTCPNCLKTFQMSRNDIVNNLGMEV